MGSAISDGCARVTRAGASRKHHIRIGARFAAICQEAAKFSWYLFSCIGDTRRIIIDGVENDAIEPGLPLVLKLLRSILGKPHTLYYYSCNCRVAQSLIVAGRVAAIHLSLISEERQSWTMLRAWTWE